jgi:hypothetical protein
MGSAIETNQAIVVIVQSRICSHTDFQSRTERAITNHPQHLHQYLHFWAQRHGTHLQKQNHP